MQNYRAFRVLLAAGACITLNGLGLGTVNRCTGNESNNGRVPVHNLNGVLMARDNLAFSKWVSKVERTACDSRLTTEQKRTAVLAAVKPTLKVGDCEAERPACKVMQFGTWDDFKAFSDAIAKECDNSSQDLHEMRLLGDPGTFCDIWDPLGGFGVWDFKFMGNRYRLVNKSSQWSRVGAIDAADVARLRKVFEKDLDFFGDDRAYKLLCAAARVHEARSDFPVVCAFNGREAFTSACERALKGLYVVAWNYNQYRYDSATDGDVELPVPPVQTLSEVMDVLQMPGMFDCLALEKVGVLKIVNDGCPLACLINNSSAFPEAEKTVDIKHVRFVIPDSHDGDSVSPKLCSPKLISRFFERNNCF